MREPWRWWNVKKRQVGPGDSQLLWRGTEPPPVVQKAARVADAAYNDYFGMWRQAEWSLNPFTDAAYHRAWQARQNYRRIALKNGAVLF